jgi:hypothetical protein
MDTEYGEDDSENRRPYHRVFNALTIEWTMDLPPARKLGLRLPVLFSRTASVTGTTVIDPMVSLAATATPLAGPCKRGYPTAATFGWLNIRASTALCAGENLSQRAAQK